MTPDVAMVTRIRSVLATDGDPYAGGDLANARRLGAVLWLTSAALTVLLLPLSPPDAVIGGWGWAVAGLIVASAAVLGLYLRRSKLGWSFMLVTSYLGACMV